MIGCWVFQWLLKGDFLQIVLVTTTVEPPISGHSKRRTPLISGQNIFPRNLSLKLKTLQKADTSN